MFKKASKHTGNLATHSAVRLTIGSTEVSSAQILKVLNMEG